MNHKNSAIIMIVIGIILVGLSHSYILPNLYNIVLNLDYFFIVLVNLFSNPAVVFSFVIVIMSIVALTKAPKYD